MIDQLLFFKKYRLTFENFVMNNLEIKFGCHGWMVVKQLNL